MPWPRGLRQPAAAIFWCCRPRTSRSRAHGDGLIATLLNFDHEVRSPEVAFADIPTVKIKGGMMDLAQEIIKRLSGKLDPAEALKKSAAA